MEELLRLIAPEWRQDFRNFVNGEDVAPEFLAYCDRDPDCQEAIDRAVGKVFETLCKPAECEKPAAQIGQ